VRIQDSIAILLLAGVLAGSAHAQESGLAAEFRHEKEHLADCKSFKTVIGCGQTLFTGHPLHIAVGSLAPGNGVGAGLALVTHWTPNETWRLNWDADGVTTPNGSWRAGAYMTAVYVRRRQIVSSPGGSGGVSNLAVQEYPVFHLYGQGISLEKIAYFGIGPDTKESSRSYFGMRQTVLGANAVWPVFRQLNMSLLGEANGRFVNIRPSLNQGSPSIEQLYTEATAPGLTQQSAFAQFGEGVRIRPQLAGGFVRLNYLAQFQEFVAPGAPQFSFNRFTLDLSHQFPLYRKTRSLIPLDSNGPNDCSAGISLHDCPPVTGGTSRNLEGSFNVRFVMNESFVPSGHVVPFYFQPTLGGSDINGAATLGSYRDYRFRAPNTIFARATFEHSIFSLPLGVVAMIDEGKVANTRGDLDFTHLRHSYTAGLTLRAGGFPQVFILFSWGGDEGRHTTVNMGPSLLGGGARPSLY
jgi:hypothetical protein